MPKFQKGDRANPRGRPKGSKNKHTTELKDAILEAAETASPLGLVGYLRDLAINNSNAFAGLLGKILPKEVNANLDGELLVKMVRRYTKPEEPPSA